MGSDMAELYVRKINEQLITRLLEPRRFMQVLLGPRQVGKTTAMKQVVEQVGLPFHYASADLPAIGDEPWLEEQWETGRSRIVAKRPAILVLDEIQKIPGWSEIVKRLWDEDTFHDVPLHVVLLGSSSLLVQKGLTESLAGRFEIIRAGHWSFQECRDYFGWDPDTFVYYGGYPGAAPLIEEPERWMRYIQDSLIETTISRDILLMSRVDKPSLLRRLFYLSCEYSGQVLSYQKMLGQLHEAGNTTTLAHYLELLAGAGFIMGLSKYAGQSVRRRGSSPKLQVFNTALITAQSKVPFEEAKQKREFWGRLVESAIGAHLLGIAATRNLGLYYWRQSDKEVDFVVESRNKLVAIEVKTGSTRGNLSGLAAFNKAFKPQHQLLVGSGGIPVDEILQSDLTTWL